MIFVMFYQWSFWKFSLLQLFSWGEQETFLFVRVLFTTFLVKDTFVEREPHSWREKADKKDAGEQGKNLKRYTHKLVGEYGKCIFLALP